MERPKSTVTVSLSQKVGLLNYSSADAFVSLTVPVDATPEEIEAGLECGKLVWAKMTPLIRQRVAQIKQEAGI